MSSGPASRVLIVAACRTPCGTGSKSAIWNVYQGSYRLFIPRQTFDACQDVSSGRNRRTGNPKIQLSGGVLRCGVCGYAMTGERIKKKLKDGGCNVHVYYKCGNNAKADDHPTVRWREPQVEEAIVAELDSICIPVPRIQQWFRDAIEARFENPATAEKERRSRLAKRRTELANMQDRLLNAYLQGVVDEAAFGVKSSEIKAQLADVEKQLEGAGAVTEENGRLALSVYDFSQNLAEIWQGSNFPSRRAILECVSSNRELTTTSFCVTK